eukprot:m.13090 g.13090  ORF g.13090 m.13090 type:complete len:1063 (+) comp9590_c0_seq1:90-3278(+)
MYTSFPNITEKEQQHRLSTNMKFGERIVNDAIPEWRAQYLQYSVLTGMIEEDEVHPEQHYIRAISDELDRLDHFVAGKIVEIVSNLKTLERQEDLALAEDTGNMIEKLRNFVLMNLEGTRKLMKKYVKKTHYTKAWYEEKRSSLWMTKASMVVHELVVHLSMFYQKLLEGDSTTEWVPPTDFKRNTSKYWVAPEHNTLVKLFIIKHLPILELTKSKRVDVQFMKQELDQTHNMISSVYLDNENLDSYHERIEQIEGAQLFRIRWYGGQLSKGETLPRPDLSNIVYVERKTHHEKWTGQSSTKERFPMDLRMLDGFLSGSIPPEQIFTIMELQGSMEQGKGEKYLELAHEIQKTVVDRQFKPMLRTVYHRTAFQRSDSNQVRISFDSPCYFVNETATEFDWSDLRYKGAFAPFSFDILEVKTLDEAPAWVEDLVATGWITKVVKFSKFQTSTASLYPDVIRIKPHWIDALADVEPLQAIRNGSASNTHTSELLVSDPSNHTDNHTATDVPPVVGHMTQPIKEEDPEDEGVCNHDTMATPKQSVVSDVERRSSKRMSTLSVKSTTSKRRTSSQGDLTASGPSRTNLKRVKVEPKTYFANERTFIQWLSSAILLVTMSTAVMSLNDTARVAGTVFVPVSLIFMFYALGVYYWRLGKINSRDGSRYDDPYGPVLLTVLLSIAIVVTVSVIWTRPETVAVVGGAMVNSGFSARHTVAPIPLSHLGGRRDRCPTVAVTHSDEWAPGSWVLHEELPVSHFATFNHRHNELGQLQSKLGEFYDIDKLAVTWELTEDVYCIQDVTTCSELSIRNRPATNEATITRHRTNTSSVTPTIHQNLTSVAQYVHDSSCNHQHLEYINRVVYDRDTMPTVWNSTNQVNTLLESPFYPSDVALVRSGTRRSVIYEYTLRDGSVGGADAAVSVELFYNTDTERALATEPSFVELKLRLTGDVGLTALRHSEAVMEYLVKNYVRTTPEEPLADNIVVTIAMGSLLALLLAIAFGYLIKRHCHCSCNCRRRNLSSHHDLHLPLEAQQQSSTAKKNRVSPTPLQVITVLPESHKVDLRVSEC